MPEVTGSSPVSSTKEIVDIQRGRPTSPRAISEIPVQEVLPMKPETAAKIKYGVWGLICGAVIAMIIGFACGGWTTSGTTQAISKEAVLARHVASRVAQLMKGPNHVKKF